MKKKNKFFLIILAVIVQVDIANCQKKSQADKDTSANEKWWHVLVKRPGKPAILAREFIIEKKDIVSQTIYKDSTEAIKKYGKKKIVIVTLKENLELVRIEKLFKKYNISEADRSLPIKIDGKNYLFDVRTIVSTDSGVNKIEVATNKEDNTRYLSITTNRTM